MVIHHDVARIGKSFTGLHVAMVIVSQIHHIFPSSVIDPFIHKYRANQSYKAATNPDRVAVLRPDMTRVRAKQQEETVQRSIEAEEERKKKLAEERERKRVKSPEEERWERLGGEGNKLGDTDDSAGVRRRR